MGKFQKILRTTLERGETVTRLAKLSGYTRQHIYNILDGKTEASLACAEQLLRACGHRLEMPAEKTLGKMSRNPVKTT